MDIKKIDSWRCGNCDRAYVDQAIAARCCTCHTCGKENAEFTGRCRGCSQKRERDSFEKADRVPSPLGISLLYSNAAGAYVQIEDIEEEYLDFCSERPEYDDMDGQIPPISQIIEDMRLYVCDLNNPEPGDFSILDYFSDYLPTEEDFEPPGWQEAENAVNDFIKSVPVWSYYMTSKVWNGEIEQPSTKNQTESTTP